MIFHASQNGTKRLFTSEGVAASCCGEAVAAGLVTCPFSEKGNPTKGRMCPVTNPPANEPTAITITASITKIYFNVLFTKASNFDLTLALTYHHGIKEC